MLTLSNKNTPHPELNRKLFELSLKLASMASLVLMPIILWQGLRARRTIPKLPEASGPTQGVVPASGPPLKLLVVGESTVAGVGASNHQEGLTGQIAGSLVTRTKRSVVWQAIGRNGLTANAALKTVIPQIRDGDADVIVVALGVNDVMSFNRATQWGYDLRALIIALREQVGPAPVVLSAIPPVDRFPALPHPLRDVLGIRTKLLNSVAQQVAEDLPSVRYVTGNLPPQTHFFCADKVHPSPAGYAQWGSLLADEIIAWGV